MIQSLVLGKVAVTPEHPVAASTAGFKLFAAAEIAADAGDLSGFNVTASAHGLTARQVKDSTMATGTVTQGIDNGNQLAAFIESCVATVIETLQVHSDLTPNESTDSNLPAKLTLPASTRAVLGAAGCHEIAVRLLSSAEMAVLNRDYRGKSGPTNVLSFPATDDADMAISGMHNLPDWHLPLGDIAICTDVVIDEADQQGKPAVAHLAHMVVHGVLHLLGYDHASEQEAGIMEMTEARVLIGLGYSDPYIAVQHEVTKKNS